MSHDRSSVEHLATTLPPDLMPTQTFQPAFGHDKGAANLIEAIEGAWDGDRVLHELRIDSESPTPAVPSDLKIEYEVGSGGLGIVDAAHQSCLGRLVAVKRVRPGLKDRKVDKHLRLEGELMGRLEHPCIPPIHLVGVDAGGWTVLVMKLIHGRSWEEMIETPENDQANRGSRTYVRKHLDLFYRIGEALSFAHENGIIHRDIKPDNVVVGDFGEVYLIDWGLAAEATLESPCEPGGFAGTPVYASPEMISRKPRLDARTDVYLLGAT